MTAAEASPRGNPVLADAPSIDAVYADLYAQHAGLVLKYLSDKIRDHATAEDVAQEAWLKAHRGLPDALGRGGFAGRAWVMQIATFAMYDHFRRVKARPQTVALDDAFALGTVLPASLLDGETPERVAEAGTEDGEQRAEASLLMELLPRAYRRVLWLREWRGYSYEQMAVALKTTVPAIKSRLLRVREAQRVLWEREQHYRRANGGGGGVEARLWRNIPGGREWALAHPDECWPWVGWVNIARVPMLNVHGHTAPDAKGKAIPRCGKVARRLLYAILRGVIPPWVSLSPCPASPECINPAHFAPTVIHPNNGRASREERRCDPTIDRATGADGEPGGNIATLGAELRRRRLRMALNITDVARAAGVTPRTVQHVERAILKSPVCVLDVQRAVARLEARYTPAPTTGAELRERRTALGLSHRRLAALSGVCADTISNFETGRHAMHPPRRRRVQDAFDRLKRERQEVAS